MAPNTTPAPFMEADDDPNRHPVVAGDPALQADLDMLLGETWQSSTKSLTDSIRNYRTIYGRTFHSDRGNSEYWSPNDEKANEAQDIAHHMKLLALGGQLFLAPIDGEKIDRVLDIGTGTGIWAIDFADAYPNVSSVVGTDISPIQPAWVPPSVHFEIEDCTQTWSFDDNAFDLVHIRWLYGSVLDWKALFREAYRVCKPGGWIESNEASPACYSDDGSIPPGGALAKWGPLFEAWGDKTGRTFRIVEHQTEWIAEAGFEDLRVRDIKFPCGRWPKEPELKRLGQYTTAAFAADIDGHCSYVAKDAGWTPPEIVVFCAQIRAELKNPQVHAHFEGKVVCGRKPEKMH